ncbi:MAG: RtcB family protein [Akkermansiaceae bacterium]
MASPTHIYPGPVGVDIKCSMSLLQFDIDDEEIADPRIRRELIKAICDRTPTGAGKGSRSKNDSRKCFVKAITRASPARPSNWDLTEAGTTSEKLKK